MMRKLVGPLPFVAGMVVLSLWLHARSDLADARAKRIAMCTDLAAGLRALAWSSELDGARLRPLTPAARYCLRTSQFAPEIRPEIVEHERTLEYVQGAINQGNLRFASGAIENFAHERLDQSPFLAPKTKWLEPWPERPGRCWVTPDERYECDFEWRPRFKIYPVHDVRFPQPQPGDTLQCSYQ